MQRRQFIRLAGGGTVLAALAQPAVLGGRPQHAQGLAMQPLSQALQEYPEQQKPYADIHALAGATRPGQTVPMWARVGYAQAVSPAPRRALQDFIQA